MRRTFAVAGALVLALAACGGDDDDTTATEVVAEAPAGSDAPATSDAPTGTAAPAESAAAPGTTAVAGTTAAGDGVEYASADGSYTVTFPGEPAEQTQEQPLPDGSTLPVTFVLYEEPKQAFIISVIEYAPEVTADLQGAVDGAIANSGATLTDEQDIELGGRQGRQLVADVQGQGTLIARIYVEGNRLWQIIYTGEGALSPDDPVAAAFFDSFQFTEGG